MLNDLKELLAIESIMGEPSEGAPFGEGPRRALDWFLEKAASYGLTVGQSQGYCGWAEYGNEGPLMGILCHLDVVPVGEGWSYPPFTLTVQNGYLYGRGVVDNKGPAVVALHVLKTLREKGIKLRHRVRVIVGCNEENGSACVQHYAKNCEIPAFNFVPDADFPVINSEKGIAHLTLTLPVDPYITANLSALDAGSRPNIVPDHCAFTVRGGSPLYKKLQAMADVQGVDRLFFDAATAAALIGDGYRPEDFSAHFFPDRVEVEARGVAGHAMAPDKGENAFYKAIALLGILHDSPSPLLDMLGHFLCTPLATERLGIAKADEQSGKLTLNTGVVHLSGDALAVMLDLRLPISANFDAVCDKLRSHLPQGGTLTVDHWAPNLFVDKNSPLIRTLLQVYAAQTGEKSECVQSGGGTYARELPHSVAFGPTFPDTVTNIHNIDECISTVQFHKLFDIYYAAVLALDKEMA